MAPLFFEDMSRETILALVYSAVTHAAVGCLIFLAKEIPIVEEKKTLITVVSLHQETRTVAHNLDPQPRSVRRQVSADVAANYIINSVDSIEGVSEQSVSNQDVDVGESDIESSLGGRPPATEAERYLAEVREQVSKKQIYPPQSKLFREQGTVRICLTLDRSGSIVKVEMIEASPFKRINEAALKAVTSVAQFRPFPDEVGFNTWKISLPIRFSLTQS
jgi:TonB family protein